MFISDADPSFHTHVHTTVYMPIMQLEDIQNRNDDIQKYTTISSKMNRKSNEFDRHNIRHIECIMHVNDDGVVALVRKSI